MKKGAALSVVLALGGTAMFWVTQPGGTGVWAMASDASDTTDIIVPARTANLLFMSSPGADESHGSSCAGKYDERPASGQAAARFALPILCGPCARRNDTARYFVSNAYAPFQSSGGGVSM